MNPIIPIAFAFQIWVAGRPVNLMPDNTIRTLPVMDYTDTEANQPTPHLFGFADGSVYEGSANGDDTAVTNINNPHDAVSQLPSQPICFIDGSCY